MPRSKRPIEKPETPLQRFATTLPGVDTRAIKNDLARLNFLHRTGPAKRWRVRQATAKKLFEARIWAKTGKLDIFPTEAGKALLWQLYEEGALTMKIGCNPPSSLIAVRE